MQLRQGAHRLRRTQIVLVLFVAVMNVGCAGSAVKFFDKPKDYSGPYGYVVGSMIKDSRGVDASPNGGSGSLRITSDNEEWQFYVDILVDSAPLGSAWDFETEDVRGFVFLIPVAPGNYKIDTAGGHFGFTSYWPKERFSLPFTVEEGKSTYLGEYTFRHRLGGEFIGPYFSVTSNTPHDYQVLSTKYPEFDPMMVSEWQPDKSVLFYVVRESEWRDLADKSDGVSE